MHPRYQFGTLTLRKRKTGPDVWQWRYTEGGRRKSVLIGTSDRLPTKAAALRAVEAYRLKINQHNPQTQFRAITLGAVIDRYFSDELQQLRRERSPYKGPTDFVFAGDSGNPRWRGILLTDHILPAANRAGIGKIGWHTFRHTFSTLIHSMGTDMAVQKELLRHADIRTTMNIYTQAVAPAKRKAIRKITKKLLNG